MKSLQECAKGYRYEGKLAVGLVGYVLYRRDGGSSATYTYAADPLPTNEVDWLPQANGRGSSDIGWSTGLKMEPQRRRIYT
jgi:hypothetical protein